MVRLETLGERLGLVCREGRREPKPFWKQGAKRTDRRTRRLCCDRLEERTLMSATPGYDYVIQGEKWSNPSHISYSIAPDGVWWDHGTNNLNATFNAKFGTSGIWERQIALALATWESVANINIVPVFDGPYDYNTLGWRREIRDSVTSAWALCISRHHDLLAQTCYHPEWLHGRGRRRDQHIHGLQYWIDL